MSAGPQPAAGGPRSLAWRLAVAFLVVALAGVALVAVLVRLSTANLLDRLVVEQQRAELEITLARYYQARGSWDGLLAILVADRGDNPPVAGPGSGPTDHNPARRDRRDLFGLADARGVMVVPLLPDYPAGSQVPARVLARGEPVEVAGEVVGTILTAQLPPGLDPAELAFLTRTNRAVILASLGAIALALIVGVLLARSLTRPLAELTQAAHRMAAGALAQQVPVRTEDELGELAAAFNQMSQAVSRANQARRQMTSDVAHELRTPLTVIGGYVESMREGVLAPTPERLAVVDQQIQHLLALVGDLRTLAQADAGELRLAPEAVSPAELLQKVQTEFAHQATQQGVSLAVSSPPGLPTVWADEGRLRQVLANLLSNALRYTEAGGRVTLSAASHAGGVRLQVADTGTGIAPEHLPHVFNRLYRADAARADDAHQGLGLAIARALVEALHGRLTVESELGRGSTFNIDLPAAPPQIALGPTRPER